MPLYLNMYNISQGQKAGETTVKETRKSKIDSKAVEEFDMETDSTTN